MPDTLSPTSPEADSEVTELIGGNFEPLNIDDDERLIARLVASVRGQLVAAMQADDIGVRQLARALGVSAAAVSRQLNSEGDMRFSTAAMLAHGLRRHWEVRLVSDVNSTPDSAHSR